MRWNLQYTIRSYISGSAIDSWLSKEAIDECRTNPS